MGVSRLGTVLVVLMMTMTRRTGLMASRTLGAHCGPGCVLSTSPSEALVLTQPNEVSITDSRWSAEDTMACAQDHPASGQRGGLESGLCAEPLLAMATVTAASPRSPRTPCAACVWRSGTTPRSLARNISCDRTWRDFPRGSRRSCCRCSEQFCSMLLLRIDPFTANEITVWGIR